jgi:hypothetical protein
MPVPSFFKGRSNPGSEDSLQDFAQKKGRRPVYSIDLPIQERALDAHPGRPKSRLEIEQHRLEEERMNPIAYGCEQQVHVMYARRLEAAIHAERIQLARGEREGRLAASVDRIRAAVGAMLISAGERIGQEAMRRRERKLDAERYDTVRQVQ